MNQLAGRHPAPRYSGGTMTSKPLRGVAMRPPARSRRSASAAARADGLTASRASASVKEYRPRACRSSMKPCMSTISAILFAKTTVFRVFLQTNWLLNEQYPPEYAGSRPRRHGTQHRHRELRRAGDVERTEQKHEEEPPGARVVLHDVEHRDALAAAELVAREGVGEQTDSLLDLAEALLAQAPLIERVAAREMLAQGPRLPDAELGAAHGVDAVTHGDDGVEAVASHRLVGRSNVHFLHIAFGRQLVVGQRPANVTRDHRSLAAEQLGHLLLHEPDRFVFEPRVEVHLTVRRLEEDDLAAVVLRGIVHAVLERTQGGARHKDDNDAAGGECACS